MRSDAAPALATTAVTPASYTYGSFTVDANGRLTAASSGTPPVTYTAGAGLTLTSAVFSETIPILYGFGPDTSSFAVGGGLQSASYTGSLQVAFGFGALIACTSGVHNAAFGWEALNALTTGANNMAIGVAALQALVSGSSNIAIGENALDSSVSDSNNIGIGQKAGDNVNGGSSNILIGTQVAATLVTGGSNLVIGTDVPASNTSNYLNIYGAIIGSTAGAGPILYLQNFTVATLPASPPAGSRAMVTDALAATFGSAPTGGHSTYAPVYYTGSAWIMG